MKNNSEIIINSANLKNHFQNAKNWDKNKTNTFIEKMDNFRKKEKEKEMESILLEVSKMFVQENPDSKSKDESIQTIEKIYKEIEDLFDPEIKDSENQPNLLSLYKLLVLAIEKELSDKQRLYYTCFENYCSMKKYFEESKKTTDFINLKSDFPSLEMKDDLRIIINAKWTSEQLESLNKLFQFGSDLKCNSNDPIENYKQFLVRYNLEKFLAKEKSNLLSISEQTKYKVLEIEDEKEKRKSKSISKSSYKKFSKDSKIKKYISFNKSACNSKSSTEFKTKFEEWKFNTSELPSFTFQEIARITSLKEQKLKSSSVESKIDALELDKIDPKSFFSDKNWFKKSPLFTPEKTIISKKTISIPKKQSLKLVPYLVLNHPNLIKVKSFYETSDSIEVNLDSDLQLTLAEYKKLSNYHEDLFYFYLKKALEVLESLTFDSIYFSKIRLDDILIDFDTGSVLIQNLHNFQLPGIDEEKYLFNKETEWNIFPELKKDEEFKPRIEEVLPKDSKLIQKKQIKFLLGFDTFYPTIPQPLYWNKSKKYVKEPLKTDSEIYRKIYLSVFATFESLNFNRITPFFKITSISRIQKLRKWANYQMKKSEISNQLIENQIEIQPNYSLNKDFYCEGLIKSKEKDTHLNEVYLFHGKRFNHNQHELSEYIVQSFPQVPKIFNNEMNLFFDNFGLSDFYSIYIPKKETTSKSETISKTNFIYVSRVCLGSFTAFDKNSNSNSNSNSFYYNVKNDSYSNDSKIFIVQDPNQFYDEFEIGYQLNLTNSFSQETPKISKPKNSKIEKIKTKNIVRSDSESIKDKLKSDNKKKKGNRKK
ncbi:poly [adp-ribose] polymerase [Anaeramoeba ignava]|uniref:Poly [adp-ribose] polymerase n=1 Tax=Anaeramoeba ignava TaxID=1746090 RepID=A0A9Q0RCI6_ANAIG|nr:poly [adp-ribose] polymerase [Anaeramoeba ignava]